MHILKKRWHRFIGCTLVLMLTAGCFQAAGGADLQPTPEGQVIEPIQPPATQTPAPTEPPPVIDIATEPVEPPPEISLATQEVVQQTEVVVAPPEVQETEPVVAAQPEITQDVVALLSSATPTETEALIIPSATPTPFEPAIAPPPSFTPITPESVNMTGGGQQLTPPTLTPTPSPTATPIPPTQGPTLAPLDMTYTMEARLANPTAIAQLMSPTPEGFVDQPAIEINPEQTGLDPIAVTATFIVEQATMTAGAPLTLTALGSGVGVEQPTETIDPNLIMTINFIETQSAAEALGQPTPEAQAGAAAAPLPPGADCVHEVRRGETLYRISTAYGLPIEEIAIRNGIVNINLILVGQRLTLTQCGTTGITPPPTSTPVPTVSFGVPVAPGQGGAEVPIQQSVAGRMHIVRQYETLFQISMSYGVSVEALQAANGIANINLIFIGQQITIP